MNTLSLFRMPFSEFQLKDTVSMALQQSIKSPLIDKFSIENQLYNAVKNNIQGQLKNLELNQDCPTCPPQNGLRTHFMVTLQVKLDYRVSFKAGIHAGLEYRSGDFYTNQSLNLSVFNSGLGTPIYSNDREKRKVVIDLTGYLGVGIGKGEAKPMNQYVINYDTPMPVQNTFEKSFSYGQALTWNSAINKKIDLEDIQREGIWNMRIGDFALSTNNDTKRGYFGGGTDHGWTGGIILSFAVANLGVIEMGYQNFTGRYNEQGTQERQMDSLKKLKKEGLISKKEFEQSSYDLLREFPYHSQDDYQKSLNRASNFFRIQRDMNSIRLDIESNGWFQNGIHNLINDFKFRYDNPKPVGIWIERVF